MLTITRHELDMQSHSFLSYLFCAGLLFLTGLGALYYNINNAVANFEYVLSTISLGFVILIPVLTMKSIAEERKQKTDQLLYSLPLSMDEIVCGKYLAMLTIFAVPVVFICVYPLLFKNFGELYLPTSYGSIFAFFLLGAALIAVGMFISSLTENQGLAAGITAVAIAFNYYSVALADYATSTAIGSLIALIVIVLLVGLLIKSMTKNTILSIIVSSIFAIAVVVLFLVKQDAFVGLVPNLMSKLSLFDRMSSFVNGDFDITAIIYYLSVAAFFIFLTIQSMEKRRYN